MRPQLYSQDISRVLWILGLAAVFSPIEALPIVEQYALQTYEIQWKECSLSSHPSLARFQLSQADLHALENYPDLSCAELDVPVDWSDESKGSITIGMTKLSATDPEKCAGSLIFNPGGPGGWASWAVINEALGWKYFTQVLRQHYDIIGPDPRGVGISTPIRCDPNIYNERATMFPQSESEFRQLVAKNAAFGKSCRDHTGPLFYHLDTTSAAKDLEAIRLAIGADRLNWLGESYGSQLGAAYAELYPQSVGRMVLDGIVDHSQSETSSLHAESSTYEDVLNQFFEWCNTTATEKECPFKGQNLPRIFDGLVNDADKNPVPAPACSYYGCRANVTGEEMLFNIQGNGYLNIVPGNWPSLAFALSQAVAGNATLLSSSFTSSNRSSAFPGIGITCLDWFHNATTLADIKYKEQLGSYVAPHTRGASQSYSIQISCVGWPAPVVNPNHYLDLDAMSKVPPILLVNSYHDPETSFVWAEGLKEQIPSGILVARNGSGHTSYSLHGETTAVIDAYLVNGTLPRKNLVLQT